MVDDDYRQAVESACKELVREGNNPVRAGQIAEKADIEHSSRLGMVLSYGVLNSDEIDVEVIKYDDKSVSNEYRIHL